MKTKLKIIIPIIVAVAAVIIAAVCIKFNTNENYSLEAIMSTAQQYLTEQKYEQAIAEFEKVIQIDPRNVDAYIGIAQAYELIGDTEKALEWLQKGFDITGDPAPKAEIDRLGGSAEVIVEQTAEETVESTATPTEDTTTAETVECDITLTEEETTVTETTVTTQSIENKKADNIKNAAYEEVINKFIGYNYGTAGTTEFYYFMEQSGDKINYIPIKMEYGNNEDFNNGNWETEASIDSNGILTVNKREHTQYRYMSCIEYNKSEKKKYIEDGWYPATKFTLPIYLAIDFDYESFDDNIYIYKHKYYEKYFNNGYGYKLFVYVNEDNIEKIIINRDTSWSSEPETITFEKMDNTWIAIVSEEPDTRIFPYKNGLPEGYSKEDLEVSDNNYTAVADWHKLFENDIFISYP